MIFVGISMRPSTAINNLISKKPDIILGKLTLSAYSMIAGKPVNDADRSRLSRSTNENPLVTGKRIILIISACAM